MGTGPVPAKARGSSAITFQTITGLDFDGGHFEQQGVDADGEVVDVPLHEHRVSLDFVRLELGYDYTFKDNWDLWFRLPYEVKRRTASIVLVEPASALDVEAMERNSEIHHEGRTLTGPGDLRILAVRRVPNLGARKGGLDVAFGMSLPLGATEGDPFEAGDAGLEHEHIQFGTGTFDPLLELYYSTPLTGSLAFGAFGVGRFPLYENRETYTASTEVTTGMSFLVAARRRLAFEATLTGYYQGSAHWNGERDVNSGLRSLSGGVGATFIGKGRTLVHVGTRRPIAQETFDDAGDTYEQGWSFLLHVQWLMP